MAAKIVITLEETDLLELQEIIMEDDKAAALDFLKNTICPKIPSKGTAPCDSTRLNPYIFKGDRPH